MLKCRNVLLIGGYYCKSTVNDMLRLRVRHTHKYMHTHAHSAFEGISFAPWARKDPRCQRCWKEFPLYFVAPWPLIPSSSCLAGPPIVKPPGWHHVYRWMWHRALGACSQTLAKAHPPSSLGSSSGSSGSRPGAGDISLMLICLHSTQLATSSLSMFLSAALPLSDAEIWFGESREEQKGVEHIDSASTAVSLTLFIPLSSVLLSLQPSPLYLSLSIHFFSFSLQRAIIITPLLDTQAINQGLPSSCAHLPWREQNQ